MNQLLGKSTHNAFFFFLTPTLYIGGLQGEGIVTTWEAASSSFTFIFIDYVLDLIFKVNHANKQCVYIVAKFLHTVY